MRLATLVLVSTLSFGCKEKAPASPPAASSTAPSAAASPAPKLKVAGKTDGGSGSRAAINCEALIGVAAASSVIGDPVILTGVGEDGREECLYAGAKDSTALLDVTYYCRESALGLYRTIEKSLAAGEKTAPVGKKAVVTRKDLRGIVQFLDDDSPCGAEVATIPPDRAVEAARLVARNLKEGSFR